MVKIGNDFSDINPVSYSPLKEERNAEKVDLFGEFYDAAIGIFNEANNYQHQSDQVQLDFITGKTDNILSVMMAQEKAYSSLNFTVQVTNKIIEAYKEIMRFQM